METDTQSQEEKKEQCVLTSIRYSAGTDIGKRREENQDSFGVIEKDDYKLYVVADGMGGVKGGALASSLAIETFKKEIDSAGSINEIVLAEAVSSANDAVYSRGCEEPGLTGMGTTFVGLCFIDDEMLIMNVGDSRAYRLRYGKYEQLTEDHTLVSELLKNGAITSEQVDNHPVSHMLTRSLGPAESIQVDCFAAPEIPQAGDLYLLCSDGLYNMVSDDEMAKALSDESIDESLQSLIDLANERGGTDNITIILVQVEGDAPPAPVRVKKKAAAKANGKAKSSKKKKKEEVVQASAGSINLEEMPEAVLEGPQKKRASKILAHLSIGCVAIAVGIAIGQYSSMHRSATSVVAVKSPTTVKPPVAEPTVVDPVDMVSDFDPVPAIEPEPNSIDIPGIDVVDPIGSGLSVEDLDPLVGPMPDLPIVEADEPEMTLMDGDPYRGLDESYFSDIPRGEAIRITKRKISLRAEIKRIERKISELDRPFKGEGGSILKSAPKEQERIQKEIDDIALKVNVVNRKVTIWQNREEELEEKGAIEIAERLVALSDVVRKKRNLVRDATYSFFQEREISEYDPSDVEQKKKVRKSLRLRSQRLRELEEAVKGLIDKEMDSAAKEIARLTGARDELENELKELKEEVSHYKAVLGQNKTQKNQNRTSLEDKLTVVQSELAQYEELIPRSREILE